VSLIWWVYQGAARINNECSYWYKTLYIIFVCLFYKFFIIALYSISDDKKKKTNADVTVDELIVDSNVNQSIEDDTFISQIDTTMLHHNMARLIPCPQTPVSRENSRHPTVSPNIPHPNTVQLLPFPQSSVAPVASPRSNRLQPTSSPYVFSSHGNRFQPTTSASVLSPRVNRFHLTSPVFVVSPRINRIQPPTSTSVANSNIYRPRTNTNIGSSSRYYSNLGGSRAIRQILH